MIAADQIRNFFRKIVTLSKLFGDKEITKKLLKNQVCDNCYDRWGQTCYAPQSKGENACPWERTCKDWRPK